MEPRLEITAVDKFTRVIREAKMQLTGLRDSVGKVSAVTGTLGGGFASLAATFAAGGIVGGVKSLVDGIDDLADSAQGLGTTAVALSELQVAARTAGVGTDELGTALTKLNIRITDAAAGGKDSQAIFKALGVTIRDAGGNLKGTEQVLGEVADRFASYRDGAEKSALAVELFGRSGAKLIAFLNSGSAGLRTYSGLTEETVKETTKLAREFDELAANAERAKNAIAGVLVPAINSLFDSVRQGTTEQQIGEIETILKSLNQQANASSAQNVAMYTAELTRLKAVLADERMQRFLAGGNAARRADSPAPSAPIIGKGGPVLKASDVSDSQRALASYVEQLFKVGDALEGISEEQKALALLRSNPSIDTAQVRELVVGEARLIDLRRQQLAIKKEDEALDKRIGDQLKAIDDQLDTFSGRAADAVKIAQTARLEARLAAGEMFSPEELDRMVKGIGGIRDEVVKTKDVTEDLGLIFESAFEDAIVAGKELSDVLKGLLQDIARLFLREYVTKPLFNTIGSFLGFGGARASGGPVSAGNAYLVGERGPELFLPNNSGRILPNGGMGGVTIVQNNSIDARSDINSIRAMLEANKERTLYAVQQQLQRRGALARA